MTKIFLSIATSILGISLLFSQASMANADRPSNDVKPRLGLTRPNTKPAGVTPRPGYTVTPSKPTGITPRPGYTLPGKPTGTTPRPGYGINDTNHAIACTREVRYCKGV